MGFVRGVVGAVKLANAVKTAKDTHGDLPSAAGAGVRNLVKSSLPFGTGLIVDKFAGDKIQQIATDKARGVEGKVRGAVSGRLGHFTGSATSSSNNSPWDDWGSTPTASSVSNSQPKTDPWAEW